MKTHNGFAYIGLIAGTVIILSFGYLFYSVWQNGVDSSIITIAPLHRKAKNTNVPGEAGSGSAGNTNSAANTNSAVNSNTNSASNTNVNAVSNTNSSTTEAAGMTIITEWNVEFPTPVGMSDLSYALSTSSGVRFITQQLIDQDQAKTIGTKYCTLDQGGIGALSRTTNKASLTEIGRPTNLKIGDYYYWFEGPQSTCSSNQEVTNMQSQQAVKLRTAIESGLQSVTTGWKTYTNSEFGFSFKHPSDWNVTESTSEGQKGFGIIRDGKTIFLVAPAGEFDHGLSTKVSTENVLLDGQTAVKTTYQGQGGVPNYSLYVLSAYLRGGWTDKARIEVVPSESGQATTLGTILSTFQFTQ